MEALKARKPPKPLTLDDLPAPAEPFSAVHRLQGQDRYTSVAPAPADGAEAGAARRVPVGSFH